MTPEALAQIAYEAWLKDIDAPWLEWKTMSDGQRRAWIAAAQAVKANVLSGFTKVGEGEQA